MPNQVGHDKKFRDDQQERLVIAKWIRFDYDGAMTSSRLIIGTRGSALALQQAQWTQKSLQTAYPDLTVELTIIKTKGDKILDSPLSKIGDKGLFTKEIEQQLLDGDIDLAVHSHKDLPTASPAGLVIAAIPPREDPADAIILKDAQATAPPDSPLDALPHGAKVLTGSLRRSAQLLNQRPDLQTLDVRGNIQTRMKKLDESDAAALIVAHAAINRLNITDRNVIRLAPELFIPACAQGALAIQTRRDDSDTLALVRVLDDAATRTTVIAERTLLAVLEGGCQVPIGAFAQIKNNQLHLNAMIASLDGKQILIRDATGETDQPELLGQQLAQQLLDLGAKDILEHIRSDA